MQRDVLEALFSAPDRIPNDHDSTRPVRKHGQSSYGRIVAKPLKESIIEDFTFITRQPINDRSKSLLWHFTLLLCCVSYYIIS